MSTIQKRSDLPKFDDIYYSQYMLKSEGGNLDFYLQESVQKIIEFQWSTSKKIMFTQFLMYTFLYLIPINLTLFTEDEYFHD